MQAAKKHSREEELIEEENVPPAVKKQKTVTTSAIKEDDRLIFKLSPKRRISVYAWRNTVLIDIRETYTASDGQTKPGKKGIALTSEQFSKLLLREQDIANAIEAIKNDDIDNFQSTVKPLEAEDGTIAFAISAKRRVSIRKWNSKILIDIREFYAKDGKQLPGSKGISLPQDQYEGLMELKGEIQQAVDETTD